MTDIRPVLVGVDASDSARDAAEWAVDLAALWGAPLDLVHVVPGAIDEPPITPVPTWMVELSDAAMRCGVEPRTIEVVPGGAVELLANRAAASRILVLGSYGDRGWSGMLAGSVALGLIGRVGCPVAVVRGPIPGKPPPRSGHVVVGVDGSPAGRAALAFAAGLAASRGARLVAVRSWGDVVARRGGVPRRQAEDPSEPATEALAALETELGPVIAAHPQLSLERDVVEDTPVRALLERANAARMLVVGRGGPRAGSGMLLGSTSRALVESAPCPVLVVQSDAENSDAPPARAARSIEPA
jgi:nucleotide-binding universal stress UspA family protein